MAPASVVLPNAKAVIVQDDGTGVMYSGPWKSHTGSSYAGNSYHMSRSAPGAFATFTFTGTEVWIYGDRNHDHGTYSVSVDGVSPVSLDSHAEKLTSQVVLFSQKVSAGKHTVRITNTDPSLVLGLDYFAYVPVDKSATSTTTKPPQANETPSPSEPSANAVAAPPSSSPASTSSRQPDSYPSSTNSKEHSDEVLSHNSDTIHLPGSTASSVSALSLSSSSDQLSASALAHSASSAHVGSLSVVALSIISMASGLVVILLSFLWCLWRRRAGRPQRDYSRHDYLRHDISQSNETMSTANLVLPTPLIIPHRVQYSSVPSPVPSRPPSEPDSETPHTVPRTGFSEKAHMAIVWNAVPSQFEDAPPEYTPSSPSTSSVPLHDPESHAGPSQRRSEFVSSLPYM